MTVVVFAGPTISTADIRAEIDADIRPPAARGDVLAAAWEKPPAIAIIDGYFDRVPSVWHKEILWAMSEGVQVFGSSSIGALRATELRSFGMEGFGLIFDQYVDGRLTADDDVAIAHASAERQFQPLSEAFVNIRATLARAVSDRIVSPETGASFERIAKRLSYPERIYPALLSIAEKSRLPAVEIDRLRGWVIEHRVDQKRRDALSMLRAIRERQDRGWSRKQVNYQFAHTGPWNQLMEDVRLRINQATPIAHRTAEYGDVLEEALVGGHFRQAYGEGLARALCLHYCKRNHTRIDAAAVAQAAEDFRRERGLMGAGEFAGWLDRQTLGGDDVEEFFTREAQVRRVTAGFRAEALAQVVDCLRAAGGYEGLAMRAVAKRRALAAKGLEHPELRDTKLTEDELWRWYFEQRLRRGVPPDIRSFAGGEYATFESLSEAVMREYCFIDPEGSRER